MLLETHRSRSNTSGLHPEFLDAFDGLPAAFAAAGMPVSPKPPSGSGRQHLYDDATTALLAKLPIARGDPAIVMWLAIASAFRRGHVSEEGGVLERWHLGLAECAFGAVNRFRAVLGRANSRREGRDAMPGAVRGPLPIPLSEQTQSQSNCCV